jgi:hypothetical protein
LHDNETLGITRGCEYLGQLTGFTVFWRGNSVAWRQLIVLRCVPVNVELKTTFSGDGAGLLDKLLGSMTWDVLAESVGRSKGTKALFRRLHHTGFMLSAEAFLSPSTHMFWKSHGIFTLLYTPPRVAQSV